VNTPKKQKVISTEKVTLTYMKSIYVYDKGEFVVNRNEISDGTSVREFKMQCENNRFAYCGAIK
jgi:hypothetical protein